MEASADQWGNWRQGSVGFQWESVEDRGQWESVKVW